jgi:cytochrome c556
MEPKVILRSLAVAAAMAVILWTAGPTAAESLDQRFAAVSGIIDQAGEMFNAAKKGHLPSLEVIKELQARIDLSRALRDQAGEDAKSGNTRAAQAKLDAAEFLAQKVYQAAEH